MQQALYNRGLALDALGRNEVAPSTIGDLTYNQITFSKNGGQSLEDAIIIMNASGDAEGVDAEYYYLEKKFGKNGVDWNLHIAVSRHG